VSTRTVLGQSRTGQADLAALPAKKSLSGVLGSPSTVQVSEWNRGGSVKTSELHHHLSTCCQNFSKSLSVLLSISRNGHHCATSMLSAPHRSFLFHNHSRCCPNVPRHFRMAAPMLVTTASLPFLPSSLTPMPTPMPTKPTSGYKQAISDTTRAQMIQSSFGS
jgi:hypothetical protein